jgi:hypothetical protein
MSVAMKRLVDFIYMVTQQYQSQQYVITQQHCNALLAGFSVGRSGTYKRNSQAEPTR